MQISRVPLTALALLVLSAAGAAPQIGLSPADTTGPSGTTGPTGTTTATGPSGASGVSGATGVSGSTGTSAATGATGTTGQSGASGTSGASGPSGPTGATGGSTGSSGSTTTSTVPAGSTGASATTAPPPPAGSTATTGVTGTTAPSGPTGSTGAPAPVVAPAIMGISSQPTTGNDLVGATGGRADAGGALAPAPNPELFSQSNPLAGVLPGSAFDPLVNAALGPDVPEFYVNHFDVPTFLLPIYQSAGAAYDVPWQVLAAINEVETNFGSDLNVSSAGAVGWMQFLPSTWKNYYVDASDSGYADPYNAADAIFAAARYLSAAGAATNLPDAIYAYNHSQAYVQSVLLRAELLSGVPATLVDSVSSLAEGIFPIELRYHPSYASQAPRSGAGAAPGVSGGHPPAPSAITAAIDGSVLGHAQTSAEIYAAAHAAAVAVQDGKIVAIGHSKRLGTFVRLEDAFGNTYTYGNLGSTAAYHLVAKPASRTITGSLATPTELASGPAPTAPASAGDQGSAAPNAIKPAALRTGSVGHAGARSPGAGDSLEFAADRGSDSLIFAPNALQAAPPHPAIRPAARTPSLQHRLVERYFTTAFGLRRDQLEARPLRVGSQVLAGTILGYLKSSGAAGKPRLLFEIRPAGAGQRLIDPQPFLDAWTQLATLELHRQALGQPLYGPDLRAGDAGQALLMSKVDLERLLLTDTHLRLTACERSAIAAGEIDRRVLATVEFLIDKGFDPTIAGCTSTAGATNVTMADSVTITGFGGVPIAGHTGTGSAADLAVQALASVPGADAPTQITSFEAIPGAANTAASTTQANEIVVSFTPQPSSLAIASTASYTSTFKLGATRWAQLDAHLLTIPQPRVPTVITTLAVRDAGGPSAGH
jgi:hypothetical protein